jgi:hypothetical protein
VNFDALPTFEDMPQTPMTEAAIRAALPPADFGVSAICVGAPVERDDQDVQEEDMEDEGMEERLARWGTVMGWTVVKRQSRT